MIDKLDLRVPGDTPFTEAFGRLYAGCRNDPKRWRSTQHYSASANFDDCGLDVLLHMECQMTQKRVHKLEILRTGEKSYAEMVQLCGRVFDCDPEQLGVMRTDLTADVVGVPVDWFKRHSLVRSKQTRRELGTVEPYQTITKGRAETLYAGVKPNQIRIYDKVAERRMQYGKYSQRHARMCALDSSLPEEPTPFEVMYGHSELATITRVERQVAQRDLEKLGIVTMSSLKCIDMRDPFAKMVFFDTARRDPSRDHYSFVDWCAGMHLQQRVRDFGISETLSWVRAAEGKNFDRAKKKFAEFLRVTDNVVGIDSKVLRNTFQASAVRQLKWATAA